MNKLDPQSYITHSPTIVGLSDVSIVGSNGGVFFSHTLFIRWSVIGRTVDKNLSGDIIIDRSTLLGKLRPQMINIPIDGYGQWINVDDTHPYELTARVSSLDKGLKTKLEILEYISETIYEYEPQYMSSQSSPSQVAPTDPALLTALAAIATNTAATNTSVNAVADAPKPTVNTLTSISPSLTMDAVSNKIHTADVKCRELIISNNSNSTTYKVTTQNTQNATYAATVVYVGNTIPPGGTLIISDPMCRGDFWAIGSGSGTITVAKAAIQ